MKNKIDWRKVDGGGGGGVCVCVCVCVVVWYGAWGVWERKLMRKRVCGSVVFVWCCDDNV